MGEVLGLTWPEIDLEAGTVQVRRHLQRLHGRLILRKLKTKQSERTLTLPVALVPVFRAHRLRQLEERVLAPVAIRCL